MSLDRLLPGVALVAALTLTATAEFGLAVLVGWPVWLAVFFPLSLDVYTVSAFRAGRDRLPALGLVILSVGGAHALPIMFGSHLPWPIVWAVSAVPAIVVARVHTVVHAPVQMHGADAHPPVQMHGSYAARVERTAVTASLTETASDRCRAQRAQHPDWSVTQIAEAVGCDRSTASRALKETR